MTGTLSPTTKTRRYTLASAVLAAVATVVAVYLGWDDPQQFFRSYLFAYVFWLGLPIGALLFILIHPLVGGAWGTLLRGSLLFCVGTMPLMGLLFLPLAFGLSHLYAWAQPAHGELSGDLLAHRAAYLNVGGVLTRAGLFLVLWSGLSWLLIRWTRTYAASAGAAPNRLRTLSVGGLIILFVTTSLASVDWLMSLETDYYSTIFGLICLAGQALLALGACIAITAWGAPPASVAAKEARDLGSLLATCVLLWAYLQYSQLIVNWSGNSAKEISWYLHRNHAGWGCVSLVLLLLNFASPFFILLFRRVKDQLRVLGRVAAALVVVHIVDIYWMVVPSFGRGVQTSLHLLDAATFVAVGAIWFCVALVRGHADLRRGCLALAGEVER